MLKDHPTQPNRIHQELMSLSDLLKMGDDGRFRNLAVVGVISFGDDQLETVTKKDGTLGS